MKVKDDLKFILPPDYVDYIRISLEVDGVLFKLTENTTVNYANAYLQDNNDDFIYDQDGNIITGQSELDIARIKGTPMQTYYVDGLYYGRDGWFYDGYWYFQYGIGGRFGLETSEANVNPKFVIDKASGVINFSSAVSDRLIVLEYISDGLESADPSQLKVHKFAEEFIYRYVKWALLNQKRGVTIYDRNQAKKEYTAEFSNTRIRLSNLHPSRLLMSLRGQNKWLK
jgi:hypothetical protein